MSSEGDSLREQIDGETRKKLQCTAFFRGYTNVSLYSPIGVIH